MNDTPGVSGYMPYSLAHTADRIRSGTDPVIAIKEHADAWNKRHAPELFEEEPALIDGQSWIDAWLAGAAEYEAFLISVASPAWSLHESRFLRKPHIVGGANGRRYGLMETPFAWRRRMIFGGSTILR